MNGYLKETICVTDNYPDGQKICGAELVYTTEISQDVSMKAFEVRDRTITGLEVLGNRVILHLDIKDKMSALLPEPERPKLKPGEKPKMGPPHNMPPAKLCPIEIQAAQVEDILAVDGNIIPASEGFIRSEHSVQPVVEEFTQHEFKGLKYNLFTPELDDKGGTYPLVVFIHDAGPCGDDPQLTLAQGNGAINFAKAQWQEKHPCYVLAPQIPRSVKLTNDEFEAAPEIYTILEMINHVADTCRVDKKRIYTTGQSQGCMASCEMNILCPELFAASLLVAGQWSPERMAEKCSACTMWILVSNHDAKAFPGMNAVTEAMEAAGAKIGRYVWNGKSTQDVFAANVAAAAQDDVNVRYTVFEGSTVVPEGKDDSPGNNHMCTWPVVYEIDALKEWLFSCSK